MILTAPKITLPKKIDDNNTTKVQFNYLDKIDI